MFISVFELFKVGIGPSSSHTVGPMRAAAHFLEGLSASGSLTAVRRTVVEVFGSLAWTGRGHGTDKAILLGLAGEMPDRVDPEAISSILSAIERDRRIVLLGQHAIRFDIATDVVFSMKDMLPRHPNGMRFTALGEAGNVVGQDIIYSIGGGFVVSEAEAARPAASGGAPSVPYPFRSGAELLEWGRREGKSVADIVLANEQTLRSADDVRAGLLGIWRTMAMCIDRGCTAEGELPGGLKVRRRAKSLHEKLVARQGSNLRAAHEVMDWVSLFALAVNEENASGGRVVTAPTNGAAGIIPAVLRYYVDFCPEHDDQGIVTFLLTAAAIGSLFKMNASISGAEVGCQGEVGVACSMAAAGLAAALGATNEQIENAAEIGMEHHLGMTCDPIGGLVQIPCIERNAMGAIKAINAASLGLNGDGAHRVSLDQVIETMRQTGADMHTKYKETSRGGLAASVVRC